MKHNAVLDNKPRPHLVWIKPSFRYLVYLNKGSSGKRIVKTMGLCDHKTAP